ncbi:hypothetical protein EYF80_015366 [Liparis tanakae]|uniref:Uncharacterized protein n=1 Tax=Liparis tanakae TaxID=230148 RepID=A0A4Z2I8U8_9TELE|nr:hypothetical protein EYF80_015366 [Liparis tanakae]
MDLRRQHYLHIWRIEAFLRKPLLDVAGPLEGSGASPKVSALLSFAPRCLAALSPHKGAEGRDRSALALPVSQCYLKGPSELLRLASPGLGRPNLLPSLCHPSCCVLLWHWALSPQSQPPLLFLIHHSGLQELFTPQTSTGIRRSTNSSPLRVPDSKLHPMGDRVFWSAAPPFRNSPDHFATRTNQLLSCSTGHRCPAAVESEVFQT